MAYIPGSVERRLLDNDPEALGRVSRWIAVSLTAPRFWALRGEWQDVHQEVLARLIESLRQQRYDSSRDFRTYVQGIARHTALQALGRRPHAEDLAGWALPGVGASASASNEEHRAESRQIARRVLELASEECRDLICAYFYKDLSYAEIAVSLDVPIGTVKSRLFRCLEAAHLCIHGVVKRGNRSSPARNRRAEEPE